MYEGINEAEKTAMFAPYEVSLEKIMSMLNNKKEAE